MSDPLPLVERLREHADGLQRTGQSVEMYVGWCGDAARLLREAAAAEVEIARLAALLTEARTESISAVDAADWAEKDRDRLRALLTEALDALEPFARFGDPAVHEDEDGPIPDTALLMALTDPDDVINPEAHVALTMADCRHARALLARLTPQSPTPEESETP